jgi:subtilisin-like proprotein convertase family protein
MYEMIDSSNDQGVVAPTTQTASDGSTTLSPGDYKSASPWTDFLNVPLNGNWQMRVTDLWGQDNGYIFSWSITFDPSLLVDCTGPILQ